MIAIACPSCAAGIPAGARFCPSCGAAQPRTCPTCGAVNPPTNRFCADCGTALGTAPPPGERATAPAAVRAGPSAHTPPHLAERILAARARLTGERKQVTVLFADVKGSTELIQSLDPEEADALLRPAVQAVIDAVHRYQGTAATVQGDGVMARFG